MNRNLKQLRQAAGLKQTDVASRLGLTTQTVFSWERGRAPVARKHWEKLAYVLTVKLDELECALVQTMLDACMEKGNTDALKNAVISGLYRPELLQEAFARFKTYPAMPEPAPAPPPRDLEYREEILKLREEIVRLREENIVLRERSAAPYRVSSSQSQSTDPITTERIEVKP